MLIIGGDSMEKGGGGGAEFYVRLRLRHTIVHAYDKDLTFLVKVLYSNKYSLMCYHVKAKFVFLPI